MDVKNRKLIFEGGVEIPVSKGERVISAGLHHTYVHTYIHTFIRTYMYTLMTHAHYSYINAPNGKRA